MPPRVLAQPEIISLIYPENAASIRVALLGEQLAGRVEIIGRSALLYRIAREEWVPGSAGSTKEAME